MIPVKPDLNAGRVGALSAEWRFGSP